MEPSDTKQETLDRRYMRMGYYLGRKLLLQPKKSRGTDCQKQDDNLGWLQRDTCRFENVCEDEHGLTKPYVLHAEANAITKIARSNNSSEGATLYVTASPCIECAKLIIQAGIKTGSVCRKIPVGRWYRTLETRKYRSDLFKRRSV